MNKLTQYFCVGAMLAASSSGAFASPLGDPVAIDGGSLTIPQANLTASQAVTLQLLMNRVHSTLR